MTDDSTRLAVLIDADNTTAKRVTALFEELAGYGTITVRRAYGDWTTTQLNGWREVLLGNAISPRQQFAYTTGKNATDAALIIDAMDLLYSGNVEGFALVSSDSDFTPLATRLRESGMRVIGVGQRKTPTAFVEACEKFVFLEVLAVDSGAPQQDAEQVKDHQPPPIESLLTKALNRVESDDHDWALLSTLGSHLNRIDPAFDPRSYGFGKLSDLVKKQAFLETKSVTGASGHGHLWVRLKGRRPTGSTPTRKAAVKTAKSPAAKADATKATTKPTSKRPAKVPSDKDA